MENMVKITVKCPLCGKATVIDGIEHDRYVRWNAGAKVFTEFPDLLPCDRESLISGLCVDCQDEIFENARFHDRGNDTEVNIDAPLCLVEDDCLDDDWVFL